MLKYIAVLITACISIQVLAAEESVDDINQFKWKNRILLINPKLACDQEAPLLIADEVEINDRDILWFVFCEQGIKTNYPGRLTEKFVTDTKETLFIHDYVTIILVGKDGGVKRRTNGFELIPLYELIDSMPMRQDEINLKNRD